MALPAPKQVMDPADDDAIINYANGFVQECINTWSTYGTGSMERAARNFNLYLGNHWLNVLPGEYTSYVYNRIKSVIMAHAAIQAGQRPQTTFTAREGGEEGICFINLQVLSGLPAYHQLQMQAAGGAEPVAPDSSGSGEEGNEDRSPPTAPTDPATAMASAQANVVNILRMIPPECLIINPMAPMLGPAPLPKPIYQMLMQAVEQGKILTEQAAIANLPAPPVIPEELLSEVNDVSATEALQTLFDAKWEECNADYFVLTDAFYCGIFGWQHMYYHWDMATQKHTLYNCEFQQVFLDPTRTDISIAETALWDYYMTDSQAIAEYPQFQEIVRANWMPGLPCRAGTAIYTPASIYNMATYYRSMGAIRFLYVRNQPYPMDAGEALRRGLIVNGRAEVAHVDAIGAPTSGDRTLGAGEEASGGGGEPGAMAGGQPLLPESGESAGGRPNMGVESGGGETPAGDAATQGGAVNGGAVGDVGAGGGGLAVPAVNYRPAYLLVVNGRPAHEVVPWGAGWPLRRGIRQITIIANTRVADEECADVDIPLTHNVNDPIPGRPTGQGTPEALEPMNQAVNQILSDMIHQVSTGSFPTLIIPDIIQKMNPEIGESTYVRPGTVLTAPKELMQELKEEIVRILQPAQVSPDLWRFLELLLSLLDKQGDMASVLQGDTDPGMSGKLFADASSAAQTSILFRSKRAEMMLKYLTKLMIGGMMNMSPEDCAVAVRKYPVYVWYAIHRWWKSGHFAYDTAVEITSGGGASKNAKANQLVTAASQGVQVSQPKLLKALDVDPDTNLKETVEYERKLARAMPQQAEPDQEKKDKKTSDK